MQPLQENETDDQKSFFINNILPGKKKLQNLKYYKLLLLLLNATKQTAMSLQQSS
jgi:hypothetical protein